MNWKGFGRNRLCSCWDHSGGTEEYYQNLTLGDQFSGRDSNRAPCEYRSLLSSSLLYSCSTSRLWLKLRAETCRGERDKEMNMRSWKVLH